MSAAVAPGSKPGPIAVLCAGGALPFAVIEAMRAAGRKVVIVAIDGIADPGLAHLGATWLSLGQLGKLFAFLRRESCAGVVLVGAMNRPTLRSMRIDAVGWTYLFDFLRNVRRGDDAMLRGMMGWFEAQGFPVFGVSEVAPQLLAPEGPPGEDRSASRGARGGGARLCLPRRALPFRRRPGIGGARRAHRGDRRRGRHGRASRARRGASPARPAAALRPRRPASQGCEARAKPQGRYAGDRAAHHRARRKRGPRRRDDRGASGLAARKRGASSRRPMPRASFFSACGVVGRREREPRRAAIIVEAARDRDRRWRKIGRCARSAADAGAAPGAFTSQARLRRRRRRGHGGGGARKPFSPFGYFRHGLFRRDRALALDLAAHPRDGRGRGRRKSGRARHHRQPRFHSSRRAAGARAPAGSAGDRLCEPLRLGMAAGARPRHAQLMSTTCWRCCRSSPRRIAASAARAAPMSGIPCRSASPISRQAPRSVPRARLPRRSCCSCPGAAAWRSGGCCPYSARRSRSSTRLHPIRPVLPAVDWLEPRDRRLRTRDWPVAPRNHHGGGREALGLSPSQRGARRIRHGDARACARRRADGRGL